MSHTFYHRLSILNFQLHLSFFLQINQLRTPNIPEESELLTQLILHIPTIKSDNNPFALFRFLTTLRVNSPVVSNKLCETGSVFGTSLNVNVNREFKNSASW